jgi:hypothetical protein
MAVSDGYLAKMRRAARRSGANAAVDEEITDLIEECRLDLIKLGVLAVKANDETDGLIRGAVRCYVRWKFGLNNPEAARMQEEYNTLRDEMRRRGDYCTAPTS